MKTFFMLITGASAFKPDSAPVEWLFSGTGLVTGGPDHDETQMRMSISEITNLIAFTDRPFRKAHSATVASIVGIFENPIDEADPPNAVLTVTTAMGELVSIPVELTAHEFNAEVPDQIWFQYKLIGNVNGAKEAVGKIRSCDRCKAVFFLDGNAHSYVCDGPGETNCHYVSVRDSGGGFCHPAASTVELIGGHIQRMDEVVVGNFIRTPKGFEPIIGFGHADAAANGHFSTAAGKTLKISPRHYLFANGKEIDPAHVKIGDALHLPNESVTVVTAVSLVTAQGAFHLFVPSGAYYVDGVLASDFLEYGYFKSVWAAGRYYVAARYYIGVPIVTHGVVDVFKVTMAAAHLPVYLQVAAAPLLFMGTIAFELVNVVAKHLPIATIFSVAFTLLLGVGFSRKGKAVEKVKVT